MKIFSIIVLVLVGLLLLGMALYLAIGAICFKIALARKNTASRTQTRLSKRVSCIFVLSLMD